MPDRSAVLEIPSTLRKSLESEAREAYPEECCGVLLGQYRQVGTREQATVTALRPTANAAVDHRWRRYEIAPEELLAVYQEVRARDADLIGYYHSHPDAAAEPSDRDLAAAQPGVSYLIVAIGRREVTDCRAWRLRPDRGGFDELQIG